VTSVVAVAGPTASGKTALALALARRLGTEVVSADSQQFYRGMEIGTAAPTPEERAQAPHHFVCFLAPDEHMAAGDYQRLARRVVSEINARGKPAVVVGGSGLYVQALVDGLFEGPPRDAALRERLRAEAREFGNEHLYRRLAEVDPEYAATLTSPNDQVRVVRALEVHAVTGKPLSQLHREHRARTPSLDALFVALDVPREVLYARIGARVAAQVAAGWIEETRALLEAGYGSQIERLKSHGYREMAAYIRGECTLDEAMEQTRLNVRRYAKRQFTWYRADPRVHWLPAPPETPLEAHVDAVLRLLASRGHAAPGTSDPPPHVSPPRNARK
jgi:tRNA dimethylallyltransferase